MGFKIKHFLFYFAICLSLFACSENDEDNYAAYITTGKVENVSFQTVVANAYIDIESLSETVQEVGIAYGKVSQSEVRKASRIMQSTFSVVLTDLKPNTDYFYKAYVLIEGKLHYGETKYFTTDSIASSIRTGEPTNIDTYAATICASIDSILIAYNTYKTVTYGFSYGTTEDANTYYCTVDLLSDRTCHLNLTGLLPATTYYYKCFIKVEGASYNKDEGVVELTTEYLYGNTLQFTTKEENENSENCVDLGLSVKWASCNVGATSPEQEGYYFAWGEIQPKDTYTEENCTTYDVKFDIAGNAQYDAARAILGGTWRMPTYKELNELKKNCTWEITQYNNIYGALVTGKNGNSIFLPLPYEVLLGNKDAEDKGYYWSSSPCYYLYLWILDSNEFYPMLGKSVFYTPRLIRPVKE